MSATSSRNSFDKLVPSRDRGNNDWQLLRHPMIDNLIERLRVLWTEFGNVQIVNKKIAIKRR